MHGVGEMPDDIWRKVLGINLDGPMFTSRRAIPRMVAQGGGSIINIASTAAISGGAAGAAYTVSKHALVGLTRNTAWMYAKQGIRCNAIAAGATQTNIGESMPRERMDPAGARRAQGGALYQWRHHPGRWRLESALESSSNSFQPATGQRQQVAKGQADI